MLGEGAGSFQRFASFGLVIAACAGACGKSARSDEDHGRGRGGTGGAGNAPSEAGAPSGGAASGAAGVSNGGSSANAGVGGDAAGEAGVAGESGGEGGAPSEPCDDGAVRCLAEVGLRERCSAGEWAREEFACATSVRVENLSGIPCATKADGRFHCWGASGFSTLAPSRALPGVRAVLGGDNVPLSWDGTLLLFESGALDTYNGGTQTVDTDVLSFDRDYSSNDLCVVTRDGGAHCTQADLSAVAPSGTADFRQVLVSSSDVCALDTLGRIRCKFSVLDGEYAELAIGTFPCARTLEGTLECATPWGGELGFDVPTGTFTRVAMADDTVCGIRDTGAIACAGLEGQSPEPPQGTFTDIDGGDRTFCAIHIDGSVRCFSTLTGNELGAPEGW
jgi:hypothetical protein